jgi:hypothetical protein
MNGLVKNHKVLFSPNIYKQLVKSIKYWNRYSTIIAFCKKNDIPVSGKPFVIYHTYDMAKGLAKFQFVFP